MAGISPFELKVAQLIKNTLNLDIEPEDINPTAPLFGEGLGLDSIDALEISMAVSQEFGFKLRSDDPDNTRIFSSLRALSEHIEKKCSP
jgi:acyl carrier protein